MTSDKKTLFFQSSLPRSGSTLLQNIIGQNPDFYVTPTSGLFDLLSASRRAYTKGHAFLAQDPAIMEKAFNGYCKSAVNGYFSLITDKPYVVDKCRAWGFNRKFLDKFVDDPKIICMVRDLRCIYTSMEKIHRAHPDKDSGIENWAKGTGTTTAKRIQVWSEGPPVGHSVDKLEQMFHEGVDKKILFIRYEDLTTNPTKEMERVYKYLGLPNFIHNFDSVEQLTFEDDAIHGLFGDHKIRKKVKQIQPTYNEVLGPLMSNLIVDTHKWFYDYFKYKR